MTRSRTSTAPRPKPTKRIALAVLLALGIDLIMVVTSTLAATQLRQWLPLFPTEGYDVESLVFTVACFIIPGWILMLALSGGYRFNGLGARGLQYKVVLNASLFFAGLVGISAYLFKYPLSRGFFILLFAVGIPLLVLGRVSFRGILDQLRDRGKFLTPAILAGDPTHVQELMRVTARNLSMGIKPVGVLLPPGREDIDLGIPVLGKPFDAARAVGEVSARAVIFAEGSFSRAQDFNYLAVELEELDAQTIVVPALSNIAAGRMTARPAGGMPLIIIDRPQAQYASRWGKRLFDFLGSALLLLILSPVFLCIAIAIKLDDGGPVIFRQTRVGLKGDRFECLKFRSMVVDAEARKHELQAQNESDGALFKMARDPRITRVGRFLRRLSLDELPQFFNVLRGDMSLVGPRPALQSEVESYKAHVRRRLDVRPGITGLWQVSGRSDLDWDEAVRLDLYYVDNWSMLQDLSILFKTISAVVTARGAY